MLFIAVAVASPGPCYLPHWLAVQWRGGGAELGAWATEQRLLFWVVLPIPDSLAGAQSFPGAADQLWDEVGANLPGGTGDVGKGAIPAGGGGGGNDLGHPGQGRSELGHRLHEDRAVERGTPFPRSSGSPSSSSPAPPAWPLCSFSAVLVIKDMMMFLCSQSAVGCVGWSAALAGGWVPSTHSPGAALMGEL